MEEIVQRDRERETKVAEKLIRSQTQENTLINSGEKKAKSRVTDHTDVCLLSAGRVIDENTIFVSKKLADSIANSQPPKSVPRVDLQMAKAATVPKNSDGTWSNKLPSYDHHPDISSGQLDFIQTPIDSSGIIKCLSCDLHFKEYKKPQYNEIEFNDGDKHCDKCYSRIVDEKSAAWKEACPASSGILSTKRRFKVPIKLGKVSENSYPLGHGIDGALEKQQVQSQTRFSPGIMYFCICILPSTLIL